MDGHPGSAEGLDRTPPTGRLTAFFLVRPPFQETSSVHCPSERITRGRGEIHPVGAQASSRRVRDSQRHRGVLELPLPDTNMDVRYATQMLLVPLRWRSHNDHDTQALDGINCRNEIRIARHEEYGVRIELPSSSIRRRACTSAGLGNVPPGRLLSRRHSPCRTQAGGELCGGGGSISASARYSQ